MPLLVDPPARENGNTLRKKYSWELGYEDEAWSIGAAHKASDSITFTSMLETELKTSVKNPAAIYPISVPGKPVGGGDRASFSSLGSISSTSSSSSGLWSNDSSVSSRSSTSLPQEHTSKPTLSKKHVNATTVPLDLKTFELSSIPQHPPKGPLSPLPNPRRRSWIPGTTPKLNFAQQPQHQQGHASLIPPKDTPKFHFVQPPPHQPGQTSSRPPLPSSLQIKQPPNISMLPPSRPPPPAPVPKSNPKHRSSRLSLPPSSPISPDMYVAILDFNPRRSPPAVMCPIQSDGSRKTKPIGMPTRSLASPLRQLQFSMPSPVRESYDFLGTPIKQRHTSLPASLIGLQSFPDSPLMPKEMIPTCPLRSERSTSTSPTEPRHSSPTQKQAQQPRPSHHEPQQSVPVTIARKEPPIPLRSPLREISPPQWPTIVQPPSTSQRGLQPFQGPMRDRRKSRPLSTVNELSPPPSPEIEKRARANGEVSTSKTKGQSSSPVRQPLTYCPPDGDYHGGYESVPEIHPRRGRSSMIYDDLPAKSAPLYTPVSPPRAARVQLPRISTDFDTVGSRDTKPLKSHFEERGNKPQLPPIESSPFSPEVVIPKSLRIQRNESAPVEPQFSGDMSDSDYDVETDPLNVDHADCNQSYSDDVLPTESSVELQSAEISGLLDTYLEEITEDLERGNMSRELVDYLRRRSLTPDSDEDEEEDDQIGELYVRNGGKLGRTSLSVVRRALRD